MVVLPATLVACCYVIIRVFFRESKPFEVRKPLGIRDVGSDFSGELLVSIENAEHRLVQKFIQPGDVVLEFGGRFGTTSCEIHTVIFEADMPKVGGRKNITGTDCRSECVDYDVFVDFLLSNDFRELASFNDCDLSRSGIPSGDWCGSWIWHAFQRVL